MDSFPKFLPALTLGTEVLLQDACQAHSPIVSAQPGQEDRTVKVDSLSHGWQTTEPPAWSGIFGRS